MRHATQAVRNRSRPSRGRTRSAVQPVAALLLLLAWPMALQGAEPAPAALDFAMPGPYAVEAREIGIPRSSNEDGFGARLFMPLPRAEEEELDEASPVFAFGHGYLAPIGIYESTLEHLASWGITVVAPRSGGALFPSHERFAGDLMAALDEVADLASEDDWRGLPVDPLARASGGHSMGGGAAVLAAAMDPSIRAVATLNAADTRPSAVTAAADLIAPILLLAGSEDRITPVERHQRPIFEAAGGPAQLRLIAGGGHCGVLDRGDLAGFICGEGSLDTGTQRDIGVAALTAWLRGELMADAAASEATTRTDPDGHTTIEIRGPEPA